MGKNKLAKFDDMGKWAHVFECADYTMDDYVLKGKWNKSVFKNENPIVLELGCGKGEYTVALSELYPDKNFIGIDLKGARMWTGAKAIEEKDIKNAVFLRTHIEFITRFFAEKEISEIWLTFPDPQMKKVRKRLTSTRFMRDYIKVLKDDGIIHLKTDSNFMYRYTVEMIKTNNLYSVVSTDDLYNSGYDDKILSVKTFYEKQWLDRGLTIKYIKFCPDKNIEWKEPDVEIEPDPYRSFGRSARNI